MKQQLRLPVDARKIVVVRALRGLGDMLVGIPALRALRAAYPAAHISLVGLPWVGEILSRVARTAKHPVIDELIEFEGYPGIVDTPFDPVQVPSFLSRLQAEKFDLAIQMHGSGVTSNPFTSLIGAAVTAGYYLPSNYRPSGLFLPYRADLPQVLLWLHLLEKLGVPSQGAALDLELLAEDRRERDDILARLRIDPYGYAIVHPGAEHALRRWDAAYFAEVARRLKHRGLQVVITGTRAERPLTSTVVELSGSAAIDLSGATSLGGLAALVDGARLLVANDTGVSHLAAARRTPSVIVYRPASERHRWHPLDRSLHRMVFPPSLEAALDEIESLLGSPISEEALRYAM